MFGVPYGLYINIYFYVLTGAFGFVNTIMINKMTIDTGNPIKIGCRPKGWPNICQTTATESPPHMEAMPAAFGTFFQNKPNIIGASRPETVIAVPVTMRLTNSGMTNANTSAATETIKTESLLQSSIFLS